MKLRISAGARLLALGSVSPFIASCATDTVLTSELAPALARADPPERIRCPTAVLAGNIRNCWRAFASPYRPPAIFSDPTRFAAASKGLGWPANGPAFVFRKHQLLEGQDIYRILDVGMPESFHFTTRNLSGSTVAITTASHASMVVEPWKFGNWKTGDDAQRAGTVNTLVHEMTHLVEDQARNSHYQDGWQWTPWCD